MDYITEIAGYALKRLGTEKTEEEFRGPVSDLPCWRQWRQQAERMMKDGEPEPVEYLIRLYGLNDFQKFCLLMLLYQETDLYFTERGLKEAGFRSMSPGALMCFWTGTRCFDRKQYADFLPGGRLWGWITDSGQVQGPGPWEAVYLDSRIRSFALGERWEDPCMEEYGRWIWQDEYRPEEMKGEFGSAEYRLLSGFLESGKGCMIQGAEGSGKRTLLRRFAREAGRPVFCMDADAVCKERITDQRTVLDRIIRECRIQQAMLAVSRSETEDGEEKELLIRAFRMAGKYLAGFLVIQSQEMPLPEELSELMQIRIAMPDLQKSAELWRKTAAEFPCASDIRPEELAGLMTMTPGRIRRTFLQGDLIRKQEGLAEIQEKHLRAAAGMSGTRMAGKAVRVEAGYGFEDLILPESQKEQLRLVCSQVKNRYLVYEKWGFSSRRTYGTGISLVFSGPPGTGKTMAAQVMASELGLELYKVDLAAVVSKYVGETEKNLNQIFEEGKKKRAILLFDEADVLFSKRTEIKDAHDKYSNMEAAFLLQKMEEYTGTAILATNYLQNIDEAFKRRFSYIVEFPFPDRSSRRLLWESAVPSRLPLGKDVDFDFLAEYLEMSGSQIKNSLLGAAFLTADKGQKQVGMHQILEAAERELYKSGRKIPAQIVKEYSIFESETEAAHEF